MVGPLKREFTIHSALVARQSPVLNTLINNTNFKEAGDGYAELESVDEKTFIDFIQYAYTGSYGDANGSATDKSATVPPRPTVIRPLSSNLITDRAFQKKSQLWEKFKAATFQGYYLLHPHPRPDLGPVPGNKPESLRETLLRHARVCVFADCYGIGRLMELALHNLGRVLIDFHFNGAIDEDFVVLLRSCYDNAAPESLKTPLVLFAAHDVVRLFKKEAFQELVKEHSDLSTALIGRLVERLE